MDAPDELVEAVAQAFMEAWWANSLHAPTDWDRMSAHARQAYLDGARAVLSMPALAEVIARDAKVREIVDEAKANADAANTDFLVRWSKAARRWAAVVALYSKGAK